MFTMEEDHKDKIFHIYTETLVVEEGLMDWYELQWEDDKEESKVLSTSLDSFSFFDITGV